MRKTITTVTIAMLLIMPLLLVIPLPAIAEPTKDLSSAIGGGTGGEFHLDPNFLYTTDSDVMITGDTYIYGNDARIDLNDESIVITGAFLYIERCYISNGDEYGLHFEDDASGFVYKNVIVDCEDVGIYIEDSSDITIKENSIIWNGHGSPYQNIYFEDSTNLLILENEISFSYEEGIEGDNSDLYEEDPTERHNIVIKGNEIVGNNYLGIELDSVVDVSIASNLMYANSNDQDDPAISLDNCPIVSITNNKIIANYYGGIYLDGDEDWNPEDPNYIGPLEISVTISNNMIMGNYDEPAIEVEDYQNVVITYNQIVGNTYDDYAVELSGDDEDFMMEPIFFAYNVIKNNYYGVYMDVVSDVEVLFNVIEGTYEDHLEIYGEVVEDEPVSERLIIKGNILTGCLDDYAMEIESFKGPVIIEWNTILYHSYEVYLYDLENLQFCHNTVMYTGLEDDYGVYIEECDNAWVSYNTISYNPYYNLYLDTCDSPVVTHNTIIGALQYNVYVDTCTGATVSNNIITDATGYNFDSWGIYWDTSEGIINDNIIGTGGDQPLSGHANGIYLDSADATTVSGNTIWGNYYGIYVYDSGSTDDPVYITRNYITHNAYGIYLESGSDPIIGGSYNNRNYIIRNFADGVYVSDDDSDPTITYNNIYENFVYGVYTVLQTTDIDAENNFWGDISGPGDPATFGFGPGIGDEVSDYIDYAPWEVAVIP